MKSSIDTELPKRAMPQTDIVEPIRAKLLIARDEPRLTKSSIDSEDPIRAQP